MLSILIPIYNTTITELVSRLVDEATFFKLPIEIRCYDDGSNAETKQKNKVITQYTNVIYLELPENIGRAKLRNKLAEDALFDTLLFLDSDVLPTQNSFLMHYLPFVYQHKVVYGGICYTTTPPAKNKHLRWYYGNNRESKSAIERAKNPHLTFGSANFLIHKNQLLQIRFDETLTGYGHEDTLFAMQLQKQHIKIAHINNPVIHLGIDETKDYLHKTNESIANLHQLMQQPDKKDFMYDIKLIKYYNLVKRLKLSGVILGGYFILKPLIIIQLQTKYASLFLFDCYKLGTLLVARR